MRVPDIKLKVVWLLGESGLSQFIPFCGFSLTLPLIALQNNPSINAVLTFDLIYCGKSQTVEI